MKLPEQDFSTHRHHTYLFVRPLMKVLLLVRRQSIWDTFLYESLEGMETLPRCWLAIPPISA
ncbi:hypothetical protein Hanom_Chr04g00282561 [Helianthus anomalus]